MFRFTKPLNFEKTTPEMDAKLVKEHKLTGIKFYFNSWTMKGRSNTAVATLFGVFCVYKYFTGGKKN